MENLLTITFCVAPEIKWLCLVQITQSFSALRHKSNIFNQALFYYSTFLGMSYPSGHQSQSARSENP